MGQIFRYLSFGKNRRLELGSETLEQGLIKCFPDEKNNIQKFFYDTEKIFNIANKVIKKDMNFGILSIEEMKEYLPYIKMSTQEIIEKYFADSVELQNVLLAVMDLDSKSAAITMLINIYAVKNNGKAHINRKRYVNHCVNIDEMYEYCLVNDAEKR